MERNIKMSCFSKKEGAYWLPMFESTQGLQTIQGVLQTQPGKPRQDAGSAEQCLRGVSRDRLFPLAPLLMYLNFLHHQGTMSVISEFDEHLVFADTDRVRQSGVKY